MEAWINASLFPLSEGSDDVKEMPRRCADLRADMLKRQENPRNPGYTLFPAHHINMQQTVEMSADEYSKWRTAGHSFIVISLVVCGDYRFSFSPEIHSTNLIYSLATTVMNANDKQRIIALPDNWNLALSPGVNKLPPDILRLYQEPFGDTYAD
jgi:hypothetical protein